ncbi:glycerol-3-phosphate acyltransferase 2, mitochondrial isoform X7 [Danio rerio]|uniref:Glycerol-3-phosphate acyltransferase 2, mitochondrial isoform X7 n=3 Tax=Danio rerio TaxID=7955 RepID=A0AC58G7G2_DANRE
MSQSYTRKSHFNCSRISLMVENLFGRIMNQVCENPSSQRDVTLQPKRPALSWGVKIKRKLKSVAPFLGRFRPLVGQCCHQCTPESLGLKLLCNTPPLGFQNLTCVNETHTGVKKALVTACSSDETKAMELEMPEVRGHLDTILAVTQTFISPSLLRLVNWLLLKIFDLMFCNVQINLNQVAALRRSTQLKAPLVYVCVRQSSIDHALICLTLFCHNLRVPYTIFPAHVRQTWLRSILQRLGVVLLPEGSGSERDAEMDSLYSPVMTSASVMSALGFALSLLKGDHRGSVRIHFAQAFSLKEMCESGKCRVDGGRPLQDLLMTAIVHNRMDSIFSQKDVSWLLPDAVMPELPPAHRQQTIALTLHLIYSSTTNMAVMSTSLVSCLLLHKHRKGVRVSMLCRDICWLLEEVLFRNTDVGFGGSLVGLVHHAVSLLRPYLLLAAAPPTGEPIIAPRSDPDSLLILSKQCDVITRVFIHEAVGACAVSAMLSEVVGCGGGEDLEFDAVLGQNELTEKSLQLTHLLSPGYIPPCQNAHSFALDVVDSMVRCGVLVMEEVQTDAPVCDFMKRHGVLSWTVSDNPDESSDSDCEEPDIHTYKLSQPSQCPKLLFFLCSLLSVQLRALCWALESLHYLPLPITEKDCLSQLHTHLKNRAQLDGARYESSSIDLVKMALRTFIDLGVLIEDRQREDVYLDANPLFSQGAYKEKLVLFFKQFMFN